MTTRILEPEIIMLYDNGLFSDFEIEQIQNECSGHSIKLCSQEKEPVIMACLDDLAPAIQFILSPGFIVNLLNNSTTSAVYDFSKYILKKIWTYAKRKIGHKVTSTTVVPQEPGIHLQAGNINAIFPKGTDNILVEHYIDKLFEYLKTTKEIESNETKYVIYDSKTDQIISYTLSELMRKEVEEYKNKNAQKESDTETIIVPRPDNNEDKQNE